MLAGQEFRANPEWILAQIQNRVHLYCPIGYVVINPKGEPMGQHSVKSEVPFVNAVKQSQAFNIREQRIYKVITDSQVLRIIKGFSKL